MAIFPVEIGNIKTVYLHVNKTEQGVKYGVSVSTSKYESLEMGIYDNSAAAEKRFIEFLELLGAE